MTINELIQNTTLWFSNGWDLLSAGSWGDFTVGQGAFTLVLVVVCTLFAAASD